VNVSKNIAMKKNKPPLLVGVCGGLYAQIIPAIVQITTAAMAAMGPP